VTPFLLLSPRPPRLSIPPIKSAPRPGYVGIVVVAYNDFDLLNRCLDSIRNSSYKQVEIIVVDNSTHGEVGQGLASQTDVHYHKTKENLGFCGANNIGIRESEALGTDHTLLLNHDAILDTHSLSILMDRSKTLPDLGILTGKIYLFSEEKLLWYAGGYFSRLIGAGKNLGFNEQDRGQYDVFCEVEYSTGCFMLIPNRVFAKVGRLEERFFMYLDDIEFCLRIRKAGLKVYYEPKATVKHDLGSGSELRKRPDYYLYFSIRNKPLVVRGEPYTLYLYFAMLAVAGIKFLQFLVYPGIASRSTKLRAILWGAVDAFSCQEKYLRRFPRLFSAPKH
jgi:GT2 family glycosyltransferase